jgi:hypothetical protein
VHSGCRIPPSPASRQGCESCGHERADVGHETRLAQWLRALPGRLHKAGREKCSRECRVADKQRLGSQSSAQGNGWRTRKSTSQR